MIQRDALALSPNSDLLLREIIGPVEERLRKVTPITLSEEWRQYQTDPVAFVYDTFEFPDNKGMAPYQEEALAELIPRKRVSIRGPHGLGKTAEMSWATIWFACCFPFDTKIPTTASAWRQLKNYLWPEIRKWYSLADWHTWANKGGIVPELLTLNMKVGISCEAFALASDDADLIEGAHGTNLLYIFDESKAIPNKTWDAAEGAFATEGNLLWLACSTPGDRAGRFFQIHQRAPGFEDWWVRHVTLDEAIKAGRISAKWAEDRKRQWGEDSPIYQARVLGNFPEQSEDTLINLTWVETARQNEIEPEGKIIQGVDVARFGTDDTCIMIRQGDVVVGGEVHHGKDTMETTGRVVAKGFDANIDDIGVGGGVVDRLKELREIEKKITFKSHGINVGERAIDKETYFNLRSELHWNLRDRFKNGEIDLTRMPQSLYDRLSGELTSIKYTYTSKGQIKIESKETMKKRIGHSPDLADALMLAFAPGPKPIEVVRLG